MAVRVLPRSCSACAYYPLKCILDVLLGNASLFRSPDSDRQETVLLWACRTTRCVTKCLSLNEVVLLLLARTTQTFCRRHNLLQMHEDEPRAKKKGVVCAYTSRLAVDFGLFGVL